MTPYVSVIVPCYNKERTIVQSLQSLFDQDYPKFEVIVVDDASEDSSQGIVSSIKHKRLKRVFLPFNKGVVHAYQEGVRRAKGKYILFHDSDDMSLPDRISKCVRHIGDADVLYHGLYLISRHPSLPVTGRRYFSAATWEKNRIFREQYIPGTIFAKKEVLEKIHFPKEAQWAWDWMHHILLHEAGATYASLDEGLYEYYRFIDNSLSHTNELSGNRQASIRWIQQYLRKKKLIPKTHTFGKGFLGYVKNEQEHVNYPY